MQSATQHPFAPAFATLARMLERRYNAASAVAGWTGTLRCVAERALETARHAQAVAKEEGDDPGLRAAQAAAYHAEEALYALRAGEGACVTVDGRTRVRDVRGYLAAALAAQAHLLRWQEGTWLRACARACARWEGVASARGWSA